MTQVTDAVAVLDERVVGPPVQLRRLSSFSVTEPYDPAGWLLKPSLLIVEHPATNTVSRVGTDRSPGTFDTAIADLASRSQRVIVATTMRSAVPWLIPTMTVGVTLAESLEEAPADLQLAVARYLMSPVEAELYERCVGTRVNGGRKPDPLSPIES